MASSRDRRVSKELQDIQADTASGVTAHISANDSLNKLIGVITGPPDTPYQGGTFEINIEIPTNYPFKPPIMKFKTKIWHPNVSSVTGAICLDTLSSAWSPVQTIKTALMSLRMLLENPNPNDPQDAVVANMLMNDPDAFQEKAHHWSVTEANAPFNQRWKQDPTKKTTQPRVVDDARRYVPQHCIHTYSLTNMTTGIKATTPISSTASSQWVSLWKM